MNNDSLRVRRNARIIAETTRDVKKYGSSLFGVGNAIVQRRGYWNSLKIAAVD